MITRKYVLLKELSKRIPITNSPNWKNFLYISCDLGIPSYFTLGFGKHLFHFCLLHYYCLGITRKLCEHLSTYPSGDPTAVNWCQVMVNVRLVEGIGVHLIWYWHLSTCGYPSKTLTQKSLPLFSAKVPSLNKLISYENFTNCLEIWSEDSWNIKLCEGIPFFEIGKYLISKLNRKIAKQQTEISKNPRTMLKTNPCGRCWYPLFSKEHRLIGVFAPQSVYD